MVAPAGATATACSTVMGSRAVPAAVARPVEATRITPPVAPAIGGAALTGAVDSLHAVTSRAPPTTAAEPAATDVRARWMARVSAVRVDEYDCNIDNSPSKV